MLSFLVGLGPDSGLVLSASEFWAFPPRPVFAPPLFRCRDKSGSAPAEAPGSTCRSGSRIGLDDSISAHEKVGARMRTGEEVDLALEREPGPAAWRTSGETAGPGYCTCGTVEEWRNASVLLHLWKPLPKQEETPKP